MENNPRPPKKCLVLIEGREERKRPIPDDPYFRNVPALRLACEPDVEGPYVYDFRWPMPGRRRPLTLEECLILHCKSGPLKLYLKNMFKKLSPYATICLDASHACVLGAGIVAAMKTVFEARRPGQKVRYILRIPSMVPSEEIEKGPLERLLESCARLFSHLKSEKAGIVLIESDRESFPIRPCFYEFVDHCYCDKTSRLFFLHRKEAPLSLFGMSEETFGYAIGEIACDPEFEETDMDGFSVKCLCEISFAKFLSCMHKKISNPSELILLSQDES